MHFLTLISSLYGEARGYRRLRIRREAFANERISKLDMTELTQQLFDARVRESIKRFPYYREFVAAQRGALPTSGEPIRPAEMPIWTRDDQRAFFAQQERPEDAAYAHQTSGSTAKPVRFYVTRESYEWRTAITDRSYSWAGAEEGVPSFWIWAGAVKPPPFSQRIKKRVHEMLQRRRTFEAFRSFGDPERVKCCKIINRMKPHAIVGYSSLLVDLARFCRDHPGRLKFKPKVMVSAAEGVSKADRELLEEHLVEEVYLSYGSREVMNIGMECEHHTGYHLVTDNILTEVVDETGKPVKPGDTGRIVITDLRNAVTPLIRYEIGDQGTMAPATEVCPCGRPFPLLRSVDGRLQDVVHTPDGGKLTGLFVTYTMRQHDDFILGYQVVQDTRDKILIKLITKEPITLDRIAPVEKLLRQRLGDKMAVEWERVDELIRRPNGKVQLFISNVED